MRGANELNASLRNGAGSQGLELATDLVDDDDFGVVVLNRFDHDLVLLHRLAHLHTARLAYSRMGHIAVAPNFIGGVNDDHAPGLGQYACRLA